MPKSKMVIPSVTPRSIRRLYLDLEVSPNFHLSWRAGFKINLGPESIIKERAIICACWKWENESTVHSISWDKNQNDKEVVRVVLDVVSKADEVVGHNLDRFDWPWIRTRALYHGFRNIPNVKTVDTCAWAKRLFYLNSNKLDYIAKYLGFGGKLHTGFDLWKAIVLDKDADALIEMITYCKRDVVLLEKVYQRLADFAAPKTHVGVLGGQDSWTCPRTGSTNVKTSKTRTTAAGTVQYQMQNLDTGTYYSISATAHAAYVAAKKRLIA